MNVWPETETPLGGVFDEADEAAKPRSVVHTYRKHPCSLHTERGPEMWKDKDGTEHLVTDAMREQWNREGVSLKICRVMVGTCHTNGCDPSLPGAERWQ